MTYVAEVRETFLRLTKDVLNKTVIDSKGFQIGKIDDIVISNLNDETPIIEGIVSNKRFIQWENIAAFNDFAILNDRFFNVNYQTLDASKILLSKQLLDEQLVDEKEEKIGRADDLALMYLNKQRKLSILGICTGVQIRIGIQRNYDVIPWKCVLGFKNRPSSIILDMKRREPISCTTKIAVFSSNN